MKLVIWGLGFRGKALVNYLGKEYIVAIIESDVSKIGQKYKEIEVISFEDYINDYKTLLIIITPEYQYQNEISARLIEHNIYHFTFSSELPPNIRYNGKFGLECYLDMAKDEPEILYLYGINAFSVLLYFMLQKYDKRVVFITEYDDINERENGIIELLKLETIDKRHFKNNKNPVYITTHEYIEEIDKLFLKNHVVDAFRYADKKDEYRNMSLKKFHNIYSEKERCFIVATGPSLTTEDLDKLLTKHEFCFSVNSMCKIKTRWKPDVYVVSDGKFFFENQRAIRSYECPIKLLPDDDIDFWENKNEGEYKIHRDSIDAYNVFEFSEDITRIINSQGTVIASCIQIAAYMGFKKIFLLGTDCNYTRGSLENHFGGDDKPDMIDHSIIEMLNGYQMCKDYADTHGIKIYNATRGGMLEVFERMDFDTLFND